MKRYFPLHSLFVLAVVAVAIPLQAQQPAANPGQSGPAVTSAPATGPAVASAPATSPAGGTPKIRIDEKVYDFGEIWEGDKIEHDFAVHNDGDAVLQIPSVRAGCGCTATEWDRTVEPGGKGKIHVVFNTKGKGTMPKTVVYIQTNDPAQQRLEVRMEGKAKRLIDLDPSRGFQFGRIIEQKVQPITVKVTSNLAEPLQLELQQIPAQASLLAVSVKEVEPGKVFEVAVTPQTPLPEGALNTSVQFKTNAQQMPTLAIPVQVFVVPTIEVFPQSIMLGAPPAQETMRTIDIVLNDQGQMKVLSAASADPAVQVSTTEQVPGRRYQVRCRIPAGFNLGHDQKVDIRIATDHPARKEIVVPISMRTLGQPSRFQPVRFTVSAGSLVGKPAPKATLRSVSAREVKLGEPTGRVTVLSFWTVDCGPCSMQLLMFKRLFERYQSRGVDFLAINADRQATSGQVVNKALDLGLRMEIAADRELSASMAYGAGSVPALYLIGAGGLVEAVHVGMPQDATSMTQLERAINDQLDLLVAGKTLKDVPKLSLTMDAVPVQPAVAAADVVPDRPVLDVSALKIDLGQLKPGQVVRQTIYFRNSGRRPLEVTKVTGSEALKIDRSGAITIAPGAAGTLQVDVKAPTQPGSFAEKLTLDSNDSTRPSQIISLTGTVAPLIRITPDGGADFGRRPEMHSAPRGVTLTYTGQGSIKYLKAESTSSAFAAEMRQIGESLSAQIQVTPKGPFEQGEHTALILVTTDCPQQPVVEVPVNLVVPGRVDLEPVELIYIRDFKRVQRRSTTILVGGDSPVHILAIHRSQDAIKTQFFPDTDGRSYQLHVTVPADFVPSGDGDKIVLQTDDAEYPQMVIPLVFQAAEVQQSGRQGATGG